MKKIIHNLAQYGLPGLLSYTQTLVALINPQGTLLEWNPAFGLLLSNLPSAKSVQDVLDNSSKPILAKMMKAALPRQEILLLLYGRNSLEFDCLITPLPDGNFLFFAEEAWEARDNELAHLKDVNDQLKHTLEIKKIELDAVLVQADEVSHTDALTFLPNRRQIIADLQREVMACERYHKPLTIFMIDLDLFKLINDTYGHQMGDKTLQVLSTEMLNTIRKLDKLGRYGGEEFLFLLPATSIKSAIKLADRLLIMARSLSISTDDNQIIHLTMSIGIAQYRIGKESWDELLLRADKALYQSKSNGRDQWTVSNFPDDGIISSRSAKNP